VVFVLFSIVVVFGGLMLGCIVGCLWVLGFLGHGVGCWLGVRVRFWCV